MPRLNWDWRLLSLHIILSHFLFLNIVHLTVYIFLSIKIKSTLCQHATKSPTKFFRKRVNVDLAPENKSSAKNTTCRNNFNSLSSKFISTLSSKSHPRPFLVHKPPILIAVLIGILVQYTQWHNMLPFILSSYIEVFPVYFIQLSMCLSSQIKFKFWEPIFSCYKFEAIHGHEITKIHGQLWFFTRC